jgi:hypothetical protein
MATSGLFAQANDAWAINQPVGRDACDSSMRSIPGNGQWKPFAYMIVKTDANGYIAESRVRDSANLNSSTIYTRGTDHLATKSSYQIWNQDKLVPSQEVYYRYDSKGNGILQTMLNYTIGTNSWDSTIQSSYTYDAGNRLVEIFNRFYENGQWIPVSKDSMVNDQNGNHTATYVMQWVRDSSKWINNNRAFFTYDSKNRLTSQISQYKLVTKDSAAWTNFMRLTYVYGNNNIADVMTQDRWLAIGSKWDPIYVDSLKNGIHYTYDYNRQINQLELTGMEECLHSTAVARIASRKLSVYPNPAGEQVQINMEGMEGSFILTVYNILGDKMMSQTVSENNDRLNINVSQLMPGIYNVTLQNKNSIYTSRIIVAH